MSIDPGAVDQVAVDQKRQKQKELKADSDPIVLESLDFIRRYQKRLDTSSIDQIKKQFQRTVRGEHECGFDNFEDPDTPPVTGDVDEMRFQYFDVFDMLFDLDNDRVLGCYLITGDTDISDADPFANSLILLHRAYGRHLRLLRRLIEREVELTIGISTVFRRNSMATKSMTQMAKETGKHYLITLLRPLCMEIINTPNEELEVDPKKLELKNLPESTREQSVPALRKRCAQFLERILTTMNLIPGSFKYISYFLRFYVRQRWPEGEESYWQTAVAGFFFLRFLCPTIVTPEAYGIIDSPPDQTARRKFLLIAKVLQTFANGARFLDKEAFLSPFNDWMDSYTHRLVSFLRDLSNPPQDLSPVLAIPQVNGLDILKCLETLKRMTKIKLKKTIKLLEDDEQRKNNHIRDEPKEYIRDLNLFVSTMNKYQWSDMIAEQDPDWVPKGVNTQVLEETMEADHKLLMTDPEEALDKIYTLNYYLNAEDPCFLAVQKKKKFSENLQGIPVLRVHPRSLGKKVWNAVDVSLSLLRELIVLVRNYLPNGSDSTQLRQLQFDPGFWDFTIRSSRLQFVNIGDLSTQARKAFFINVYHLLMLHIHVIIGGPNTSIRRALYFSTFRYQIGQFHYTLNDIKHGILRNNAHPMSPGKEHFAIKKDPRRSFAVPLDARIHAALSSFTMSGPAFREYREETLEQDLTEAFKQYVSTSVIIDLNTMSITLPKTFKWYSQEISKIMHPNPSSVDIEWILEILEVYLEGPEREKLDQFNLDVEPLVEYESFNWNHNFQLEDVPLDPISIPLEEVSESEEDIPPTEQ
eukprot:TRINITY_DN5320_c0_g1_i1.p1 TRINITY_DN5320_c0_g1~~TRINITY_DN5320_c0_g1_i1.p1  ORF type:complete len:817 (+),score=204.93 TRINITY_DN5320_c0_g1_i1:25-2451(+)